LFTTDYFMKKILTAVFLIGSITSFAQDQYTKKKVNLAGRPNDHILIQLGITNWAKKPDSINTKGLSRSFNMYFMFDFPFKSNPRISVAIGPGIGTDNIFFSKTYVDIKQNATLLFQDVSDTNHFKKFKLATAWLEAPLELRYSSNPATPNKSYKFAIGIKGATLLNAHTKGKDWRNKANQTLISYTQKENSKRFFNTTRFLATARFGWGPFTLYGSYQLNPLFKEGLAPDVRPYSIGLTLSGL